MFGSIGALDGMGVTAVFTYDTNGGFRSTVGSMDVAYGGYDQGYPAMISAKISIGGKTATAVGSYYGVAWNYNHVITERLAFSLDSSYFERYVYAVGFDELGGAPVNLDMPYSYATNYGYGSFGFGKIGSTPSANAYGRFSVDHVTISSVAPVPLLASLSLGLAALAGLALMASRRRKA